MSGSEPGFEEFYSAHALRLVKVAHSIVRDRHAAEDVVQTAFAKAYAAWWRVGRADDPVAYVRRIVVNAALAHLRRSTTRRESPYDAVPDRSVEPTEPSTGRDEMWEVLEQLPPRRRAIVVLRYYEGLSEREIADVLRCRPGTVKSQASAALRTLRAELESTHDIAHDLGAGGTS